MYDEILRAFRSTVTPNDSRTPQPVKELPGVVRIPAYEDEGHYIWQGATLVARRMSAEGTVDVIVRFDDGRVMMAPDPVAAIELFQANADVWM